ncbi:hypothetical protein Nocox_11605 [Nonomuraea coxensis DSM 45129]|uniref:Uncharacterized protein n=1 Tax=Nonomuraea coxensis DSM 45129 TaxID=1122611 RepID=A0ABX8TYD4_9ACTN|nr:hypothetical protein [Nonomuraea coxensis]QYC39939.1 hypothetical protein Nocox_11605 [Nonomuraea coxensis DSM 45129]
MLDLQLAELTAAGPGGVDEALGLVAGFDGALAHGFARIGEEPAAALAALAGAMAGGPLGERAAEAVDKVIAGSIGDEHLAVLAGARAALTGAAHDALLTRLDAALGRARTPWEATPATGAVPPGATPAAGAESSPANLLAGCRAWLRELAIAGWRGVDHDVVAPSDQAIEALLAVPALRGLAVLLDGLAAELRASCPVGTMDRLPARRWGDLWTRGLLLARSGPWHGGAEPVSGRLLILGADVHEHATVVRVQVHGVLEPAGGGPARLVRTGVAASKVDTIVGPAVWRLMSGHPVLLGALAGHRALDLTDMPLLPGGDLVWHDDRAAAGEEADPFTTARVLLGEAQAAPVPPLDRHPVRIAEPVLAEGYTVDGATLELGSGRIALDLDRLPTGTPLTPELVAASSACLGLVRWDGGRWLLQPLAVQATVKKKQVTAHTGDWALGPTDPKVVKAEAKAGDAVAVLRERAGRLLRK